MIGVAVGLLLGAAGCGGDSTAGPDPDPSPDTTTSAAPIATSSPTPTGWESEYTEQQLADYDEALRRWEDYERESEPLWAAPAPTDATLDFFRSYFYNEDLIQGRLQQYADAEVKIDGLPAVLWSKALSIKGLSVRIQQCIDPVQVRVTQHGKPVPNSEGPIFREIELSVPEGASDYLIQEINDPSWGRREERCAGL